MRTRASPFVDDEEGSCVVATHGQLFSTSPYRRVIVEALSSLESDGLVSENAAKKTYRSPELIAYGGVKDLTAGGSGTTSEYKLIPAMGMDPAECQFMANAMKNSVIC